MIPSKSSDIVSLAKKYDWQLISIILIASLLHFSLLGVRPPHHDEGVNGWFVEQMITNGFYKYDPTNYHGPLHYYVLFFFQSLFGRSIASLRLPDALISILTIYWLTKFSPFIGRTTSLICALAMALSPGYIYYGGFAFQEGFQVFYNILSLWGLFGLLHEGSRKYLWAVGIGFTLNFLTKETCLIHYGCFILAWICLLIYEKFFPSVPFTIAKQTWTHKDLMWLILTSIFLIVFFYSGTFFNLNGLIDMIKPYTVWCKTGFGGGGHDKPFFYWFTLFLRYEQIALLGMLACLRYLSAGSNKFVRYIAIYGIGAFLAYSMIPYKTTWCVISIIWPFYFVFGDTVAKLLESKSRILIREITFWLFIVSTIIACKLNYVSYTDEKEPYAYVQTYRDYENFTRPLFELVRKDPSKYQIVGNCFLQSYWPIPWILNDLGKVGYYGNKMSPTEYDADFLVVEEGRVNEVEERLNNKYFLTSFRLNSAQNPYKVYYNSQTFKDIFPSREPEFLPLDPPEPGQGLLAIFYSGEGWKGTPVLKQKVPRLAYYLDEKNTPLPPPFSVEVIGQINIPSDETTLTLYSDDGGYIEIDGKRIIEDLGSHGTHGQTGTVRNMRGWRKIKIGGYDIWGYYVLRLMWKDSKGNEVVVPPSNLKYDESLANS